ncbi:transcriptional regulator [Streptomyces thermolilacinus]
MSTVGWEETRRAMRARREAAGLPVRSAEEKRADMGRLRAEVRAYRLGEIRRDTPKDGATSMEGSAPRGLAVGGGEPGRTA